MIMKKLAFATLVAMGMTAAAIAQQQPGQSGQQQTPRSTTPSTQQQPGASQTTPRGSDRTEQVTFERADKNADGQVSRQEANDIEGFDFSRADTNNDASLTRQEYQAAMMSSTPRGGQAGAGGSASAGSQSSGAQGGASASARSGGQADQSAGGAQRGGQSQQGAQPGQQGQRSAQVTFDTADKDKDGKITRAEANDVEGLNFSSADTNADASLSRQEFQTAMAGVQPRG
jgi:hypothetical protein